MSFFDIINRELSSFVAVTDAEEEVCELYSVYYSSGHKERVDRVDASLSELEIEINGGQRSFTLTIAQNPHINGELGQTGGVLWNSSVLLSEYFARRSISNWDLSTLNIVELGSGCGLVGIALHRLGAKRVVVTDQRRMMKVLTKNVDRARSKGQLFATEYDWDKGSEDMSVLSEPVDLVVVSDCVYHEEVVPMLVGAMREVCQSRADGKAVGIIGQELRSDLVHQAFVEALLDSFIVYRIPVDPSVDTFYTLYAVWLK
ncbi:hypothetical protein H4218_004912 [Coemansia sp. IMI 209128]|nr:hypothetical protein GGI10_002917 [Coemansia sp. RSA 2530]KAJ2695975.1 hypothetical protein H4218_004912 [Coemansia sp. IMI 209128]